MTKQGEDLYHYNITNSITQKTPINCMAAPVFFKARPIDYSSFQCFILT